MLKICLFFPGKLFPSVFLSVGDSGNACFPSPTGSCFDAPANGKMSQTLLLTNSIQNAVPHLFSALFKVLIEVVLPDPPENFCMCDCEVKNFYT
jgi:hypothetical protein